jgi:hypothetical protein
MTFFRSLLMLLFANAMVSIADRSLITEKAGRLNGLPALVRDAPVLGEPGRTLPPGEGPLQKSCYL